MIFEIFQNTTSISSDFSKICCKICKQAKQTTFFFYAFFKLLASNFLKNFIFFTFNVFKNMFFHVLAEAAKKMMVWKKNSKKKNVYQPLSGNNKKLVYLNNKFHIFAWCFYCLFFLFLRSDLRQLSFSDYFFLV